MAKKVPKIKRVSHPPTNSEFNGYTTSDQHTQRKKTNGAIYMPEIWALPPGTKLKVECNEFGQPIDDNSSKFVCFLGVLSRTHSYAPIDVFDWRKMPTSKKNEMLNLLKEKFDCPIGIEEWILQSIGTKWRNWKADLKFDYFDPTLPVEDLVKERDERVNEEQWRNLIMYWLSDKGKQASIRGKESRKYKKMNHKTGRKSFAKIRKKLEGDLRRPPTRVETYKECFPVDSGGEAGELMEAMQELVNTLPDPSRDVLARDDVFALTMGPDKACYKMLRENIATTQILTEKLEAYQRVVDQQCTTEITPIISSPPLSSHQQYTISTPTLSNISRPLQVNYSVLLLSINDSSKIVAKGNLRSMDPNTVVGGEKLGKNWCSVHINVALDRDERLIRSCFVYETIGEAIGAAVAWPLSLVAREEN